MGVNGAKKNHSFCLIISVPLLLLPFEIIDQTRWVSCICDTEGAPFDETFLVKNYHCIWDHAVDASNVNVVQYAIHLP